jgi:superfamily II DNA or RNA helicase
MASLIRIILKKLLDKDRTILLAIDIVKVQKFYKEIAEALGVRAEILNGTTPKKQRDSILDGVSKGLVRVLLGSGVLQKGISIPRLDSIIMLSGAGSKERAEQLIGRTLREYEDKPFSLIIDFQHELGFDKQQYARKTLYQRKVKEKGWKGKNFTSIDKYIQYN